MTERAKKKQRPINVWVCNRADGWTTFGEYINAKKRVFAKAKSIQDWDHVVAEFLSPANDRTGRLLLFKGDPLPAGWRDRISPERLAENC